MQLANFRQGAAWDVQRVDTDKLPTLIFVDYATVGIGIFAAAAGIPLSEILNFENTYARFFSNFAASEPPDPTYTSLPARNVYNTQLGYQLYTSGKIGP